VQEYLVDLNATQAAIRAGYSERTARAIGYELLTKPDIQRALTEAQQERADRLQVTADQVLADLVRLGGEAEAAGQYGAAIRASELQGKHLAMFTERHIIAGGAKPIEVIEIVRLRSRTTAGADG